MGRLIERECPENILKIFYEVHVANPEVHFVFIGDNDCTGISRLIKSLEITDDSDFRSKLQVKGFVGDAERQTLVRQAVGTIILRRNTRENRYLFPSRVVEFFQFGCPVIMNKIESFSYNFWTGCDQFIETCDDVDGAQELLLRLHCDPAYRNDVIEAQLALYLQRYSEDNLIGGISDFFRSRSKTF
jgi:glycosyltransferase involved in cell wall biosynthesis